ncbi:MAG TPA: CheB methylesterase domain-containing protein [Methanospirillum sp.]|uniref:CheB methylesterase domain-containing protein n=1 Tax=Methanospirillum sp. TaxID=45200 RepID=UPI002B6DB202|nr:CheB methylesterase domain-containing protein [Methanospirillum sp.]HOJ95491.1 CheB methylesterase domain-containing protein [Methanospirillum sp.]HPP78144.1 CheB methylesterase domain-containing protein [Methanospirillum sp.]
MNILIIGSSTGGPRIIFDIFNGIPVLPLAIIIVQHMPESTTSRFAKRLSQLTTMNVIVPKGGEVIVHGSLYVAPGDHHLVLKNNETIILEKSEKVNFVRPSVDVTMTSLRSDPRHAFYGIILSGMGCDGAQGLAYMKKIGAQVFIQDPDTCTISSMPEAAFKATNIDQVLSPEAIHNFILSLK